MTRKQQFERLINEKFKSKVRYIVPAQGHGHRDYQPWGNDTLSIY